MTTRLSAFRSVALGTISVIGALALWEIVGLAGVSSALPPFHEVALALVDLLTSDAFQESVWFTLTAIAIAFPLTVAAGLILGSLMGLIRLLRWMFDPYMTLALSVPLVAIIPILINLFGFGRVTIIAVIVVYTLPVVVVNTVAGFDSVDPDQVAMARSFGASRLLLLRRVLLPTAAPLAASGVRLAAGRAIKGAIVGEQIVGLVGMGGLIQRFGGAFAVEDLYAAIVFVGILGIVVVNLLTRLERRVPA
ncbi:MAG: ABC transporter permease subunit [Acidimicrobiia bacterium]|nr:ABC transporter permease subunit [Acidimicrobiia bacterium]